MTHNGRPQGIEPFAAELIARKARQLSRRARLQARDFEDVAQDLALRFWIRRGAFDPNRGDLRAFTRRVLDNAVADLLRLWGADKRRSGFVCSLGLPADRDKDGVDPPDRAPGPAEQALFALALDEAVASLPPGLRELAPRLLAERPEEIARELEVPVRTLRLWRRRVRDRLRRAGIMDFFR